MVIEEEITKTKKTIMMALRVSLILIIGISMTTHVMASESPKVTQPTASPALSKFKRINHPGFGNPQNRYAYSMVNFKGDIYVGTLNLVKAMDALRLLLPQMVGPLGPYMTDGAEVWKYKKGPLEKRWKRVVDDGLRNHQNMGLRTMIVWEGDPRGPAIYGTTINLYKGLEVWRTYDGDHWQVVVGRSNEHPNGFGTGSTNQSGRGMAVYKAGSENNEYLYVSTMRTNGGELWRTMNGEDWEKVTDAVTVEQPQNPETMIGLGDLCGFDDGAGAGNAMFVGTWRDGGFSVYKTYDGHNYQVVANNGINSANNYGVLKLIPFNGRLWLLTVNGKEGFDVYASRPGQPITSNSSWELITTGGFTDPGNCYAWNAKIYDNGTGERLYIGTFNPSGGFQLFSVQPNGEWAVEVGEGSRVRSGIRTPLNSGLRAMGIWKSPKDGKEKLMIGCAGIKPVDVFLAE